MSFALALGTGTAHACPPPPPPPAQMAGETDEAYKQRLARLDEDRIAAYRRGEARLQAERWDAAAQIFIGRIVDAKPVHFYSGTYQTVRIRPVRFLRGSAGSQAFWLRYKGDTDCGPYGAGDALRGKEGDAFLFLAQAGPLRSESVIDSYAAKSAIDQRIIDALR